MSSRKAMIHNACTVVVERVREDCYRATCPLCPDCETFAATEEEARRGLEEIIDRIVRERSIDFPSDDECYFHEPH